MQYIVNRGEKGKVEVKVDIPKTTFTAAYNDIIEALGKDTKISGFRSGKIPSDVIENHFGVNKILNDTASFLVSKNLSDIFKKENIVPIANPSIAVHSLFKESPFSFTATLTCKPQIKLGNWKGINIKKVKAKKVTENDVDESIKNIYEAWVKKSKVKSQKSKVEENEEEKEDSNKKFIYDAHGNKVFFEEKKTLRSSSRQDLTTSLKISDEFAKKIGARDLVHLNELVRKDLEKVLADQVEAKLEQELFDEILKLAEIEVPDILIDDELNRIIVIISQNLERQGKKFEDYLRQENTTLDALKAKLRPQAEKNVKITLIMDEIGKKEGIKVSNEEIENAAKGVDQSKLDEKQKADMRNYLAVSIFQAKSLDLVKKAVTV